MLLKWKNSLGIRFNPKVIGGAAQVSLVSYIILNLLSLPHTDFIQGLLLGFSLIGNVAMLIQFRQARGKENETR